MRPARGVVASHRRTHADALKTLGSLTDAWYGRRDHSPEWPHPVAHGIGAWCATPNGTSLT